MQSGETLSAIVSILLQTGLFSFYIGFGAIDPCQIAHIYSVSLHWRRIDAMHLQLSASHRPPGQVSTDPSLCSDAASWRCHAGADWEMILHLFIA
jgi:hypothetical protein